MKRTLKAYLRLPEHSAEQLPERCDEAVEESGAQERDAGPDFHGAFFVTLDMDAAFDGGEKDALPGVSVEHFVRMTHINVPSMENFDLSVDASNLSQLAVVFRCEGIKTELGEVAGEAENVLVSGHLLFKCAVALFPICKHGFDLRIHTEGNDPGVEFREGVGDLRKACVLSG